LARRLNRSVSLTIINGKETSVFVAFGRGVRPIETSKGWLAVARDGKKNHIKK
jgi:hypothetical protein